MKQWFARKLLLATGWTPEGEKPLHPRPGRVLEVGFLPYRKQGRDFYAPMKGKFPDQFSPIQLRDED